MVGAVGEEVVELGFAPDVDFVTGSDVGSVVAYATGSEAGSEVEHEAGPEAGDEIELELEMVLGNDDLLPSQAAFGQ